MTKNKNPKDQGKNRSAVKAKAMAVSISILKGKVTKLENENKRIKKVLTKKFGINVDMD